MRLARPFPLPAKGQIANKLRPFTVTVMTLMVFSSLLVNAGRIPSDESRVGLGGPRHTSKSAEQVQKEISDLRGKVKYVFVLYQENRSFDSYFGTFPGAEGIYSNPPDKTPGFTQPITNMDGSKGTIQPFRIGPSYYAADTDDVDHSHSRIVAKMNVVNNAARMDQFAQVEEAKYTMMGQNPSLAAKQWGELAMAYEDCDTIPLLWMYAKKFALYDHIFQEMTGPSTPGNLSIIAAQSGQTQYVRHPEQAITDNGDKSRGAPVLNDNRPFAGSPSDTSPGMHQPVNPSNYPGVLTADNQTYASLPITLGGQDIISITQGDTQPAADLQDIQEDITAVAQSGKGQIPWAWYQEGYSKEPTDPNDGPTDANGTHASYITHHNGPQYFGYIANNPQEASKLHGLQDFYSDVQNAALGDAGGVYYVKGGYQNLNNLKPTNPDPVVQKNFLGDDDHPAYSDAQISEALLAKEINAIAASPYWNQSAIIVTWDDSEGDYDHVPPPINQIGPGTSGVLSDGPRVPFFIISPFSKTNYVSHEQGDHGSVVKFIDAVFNLTPLADLPNEQKARDDAASKLKLQNFGPDDDLTAGVTDLLDGFDPDKLSGKTPALDASYVTIPDDIITNFPTRDGQGCQMAGVTPVAPPAGVSTAPPADFNPRPSTNPGTFTPVTAAAAPVTVASLVPVTTDRSGALEMGVAPAAFFIFRRSRSTRSQSGGAQRGNLRGTTRMRLSQFRARVTRRPPTHPLS